VAAVHSGFGVAGLERGFMSFGVSWRRTRARRRASGALRWVERQVPQGAYYCIYAKSSAMVSGERSRDHASVLAGDNWIFRVHGLLAPRSSDYPQRV
jgi:hypothetical protein